MFNNIGRKIKGLAKTLFWILAIISIIAGIGVILVTVSNGGDSVMLGVLAGLGIIIGGFILAWLQNFMLYGFGELVDTNQKILETLERQNEVVREPVRPIQPAQPAQPTPAPTANTNF